MKRLTALLTIIFLASSIGCDSDSSTNVTPGVVDPFVTGNYWIYQSTYYSSGGSIDSTKIDSVAVTSTRIEGANMVIDYSDRHSETLVDSGIWHSSWGALWYEYPAHANDTFYTQNDIPVKINGIVAPCDQYRYVSKTDDIITVTAGTFSTYQYINEFTKANTDTVVSRRLDNFSPNVGLVKSELNTTVSLTPPLYTILRKELIRYYLQK